MPGAGKRLPCDFTPSEHVATTVVMWHQAPWLTWRSHALLTKPQRPMKPDATFSLSRCPLPSSVRPGHHLPLIHHPGLWLRSSLCNVTDSSCWRTSCVFPIILFQDLCFTPFSPRPTANSPLETRAILVQTSWLLYTSTSDTEGKELSSEKRLRKSWAKRLREDVANWGSRTVSP